MSDTPNSVGVAYHRNLPGRVSARAGGSLTSKSTGGDPMKANEPTGQKSPGTTNANSTTDDPAGEDTVEACPYCDEAVGFKRHRTDHNQVHKARNPDRYRDTDLTCKSCGRYLDEDGVKVRDRFRSGLSKIGRAALRSDPSEVTGS